MVRSPLTNASTYKHLFVFVSREILFSLFTLFFIFSVFLNISHLANTQIKRWQEIGPRWDNENCLSIKACLLPVYYRNFILNWLQPLLSDVTSKIYQNNGECFMFLRHISNEGIDLSKRINVFFPP